jgi:hypothetical protein
VRDRKDGAVLDEKDLLVALQRHWDFEGKDYDVSHEIYHDDAVLEFPQSGERFEGLQNFKEWRIRYPSNLKFHTRRLTHRADLVVVEYLISYDGAPWMFCINVMEFRGDKVARERIYIMDGWPAAEWRAPWRAETPADAPAPPP